MHPKFRHKKFLYKHIGALTHWPHEIKNAVHPDNFSSISCTLQYTQHTHLGALAHLLHAIERAIHPDTFSTPSTRNSVHLLTGHMRSSRQYIRTVSVLPARTPLRICSIATCDSAYDSSESLILVCTRLHVPTQESNYGFKSWYLLFTCQSRD